MRNHLKTFVLLGALSALVVGAGAAVAPSYMAVFAVLALAMNLGAYWFSDRVVLAMHRATEVGPQEAPGLHGMVRELSGAAGIPMPRVFLIPEWQPNAFATGRNPEHGVVAVTRGLLDLLDPRELRGVLAHEIAHIKNRDILVSTIAASLGAIVTYLAHALSFGFLFGARDDEENAGSGLLVALVAPIAATLVQLGISRSREYLADETGARLTGDPDALAGALLELEQAAGRVPIATPVPATAGLFIVNPLQSVSSVARWFSTHPATEERVRRLRSLAIRGEGRVADRSSVRAYV